MQEFDLLEKCKVNQAQVDIGHRFLIALQNLYGINIYSIMDRSLIGKDLILVNSFIINKSLIHSIDIQEKKMVKLNYTTFKIKATFVKDSQETIIINNNLLYLRNFKRDYFHKPKYLYLRDNNYKQIRRLNQPQSLGGNYNLIFNQNYKHKVEDFLFCKNIKFQLNELQHIIFSQNNVSVCIQYCQNIESLSPYYQSTQNLTIINNDQIIWNSPCYKYDLNIDSKLVAFLYKDKKLIYIANIFNLQWQYINSEHKIEYFKILDNENLQVIYKNKMKIIIDVIKLNQFQF